MVTRTFLVFLLVFVAYVANAFADPFTVRKGDEFSMRLNNNTKYGVSWSFENAAWYGLDPRADYVKLSDSAKFDWVRLVFYWDKMTLLRQGYEGQADYDLKIDDLKFAINEAKKRNVDVVIALGAKTPYYPEYHLPSALQDKVKFGETISVNHPIAKDLLEIDRKLVSELEGYDNIAYWQVENEPFLANIDNLKIGADLLAQEVAIVRETDLKHRPIILNHVGPAAFDRKYRKLFDILRPGDVLGVNAYFKTQGVNLFAVKFLGKEIKISWPRWFFWPVQSWVLLSPDYSGLKKEAESKGVKLWVLEMQADPYIRTRSDADRASFNFSAEDIKKANDFLTSSGVESIGLWGAPFWIYREKIGDDSWVNMVRRLRSQ